MARVLHLVEEAHDQVEVADGPTMEGWGAAPGWIDQLLGDSGDEGEEEPNAQPALAGVVPRPRELSEANYSESDRDTVVRYNMRVATGRNPVLDPWIGMANSDLQRGMLEPSWSDWLSNNLSRPEIVTLHRWLGTVQGNEPGWAELLDWVESALAPRGVGQPAARVSVVDGGSQGVGEAVASDGAGSSSSSQGPFRRTSAGTPRTGHPRQESRIRMALVWVDAARNSTSLCRGCLRTS